MQHYIIIYLILYLYFYFFVGSTAMISLLSLNLLDDLAKYKMYIL